MSILEAIQSGAKSTAGALNGYRLQSIGQGLYKHSRSATQWCNLTTSAQQHATHLITQVTYLHHLGARHNISISDNRLLKMA
jgi:hypothetical protein